MTYSLQKLKNLLHVSEPTTPKKLGVVLATSPQSTIVSTTTGAVTVSNGGVLTVGDRVVVENSIAYKSEFITTRIAV